MSFKEAFEDMLLTLTLAALMVAGVSIIETIITKILTIGGN